MNETGNNFEQQMSTGDWLGNAAMCLGVSAAIEIAEKYGLHGHTEKYATIGAAIFAALAVRSVAGAVKAHRQTKMIENLAE